MRLRRLDGTYAVCRLPGDAPLPAWFSLGAPALAGVIRRGDELSLVCPDDAPPAGATAERGWHALEIAGTLDFSLTGVLVQVAQPLADAGVPIFALSTYDTDVVLVPGAQADAALAALRTAGHEVDA